MRTLLMVLCGAGMVIPLITLEIWVLSFEEPSRIKSLRLQLAVGLALIILIASRYIWKRFNVLIRTSPIGALFKLVLLVLMVLSQCTIVFLFLPIQTNPMLLSFASTFSLGSIVLLTFSMIFADICSFCYRKVVCRGRRDADAMNRMEIKIRSLLSLISALILIICGTMVVNNLAVEHVSVPIKGLGTQLNGTTIVQISDIHLGPFNGRYRLNMIVEKINQLNADIVVITGDLVDSSVESLKQAVVPLKKLKSKYGVYYSTGNHEYYTGDVDNWLAEIPKLNVTPLANQRVCLPPATTKSCKGRFYLAGLEDLTTRNMRYGSHSMDIHSALTGRDDGVPTVVLAHQPWAAMEAIMWEDVRLVLSGHTHAGQMLPFMPFVYLYNPFYVGLYEPLPQVYVYVNPGTVYYLFPFRHHRPEITVLTMTSQ